MTTNEPTAENLERLQTWHPVIPGDDLRCSCGQLADIVYKTSDDESVPYCGMPHGGENHLGEELAAIAAEKWGHTGGPGPDIYTILADLPEVQVSRPTLEMTAKVNKIREAITETVTAAKEMFAMHEANAEIIREAFQEALPDTQVDLWEIMSYLSGSHDLYNALEDLTSVCNPDNVTPDDIEAARKQMEGTTPAVGEVE